MGLCKCRVVTTLFCFQHRVNVCENCLVKNHPTCVVKTYLQWLQDSDFDPNCKLCRQPLDNGEDTIRLKCHDVFHLHCLNQYALGFPPHTAPAGYTCPSCGGGVVPTELEASPVAQAARNMLRNARWAFPQTVTDDASLVDKVHQIVASSVPTQHQQQQLDSSFATGPNFAHVEDHHDSHHGHSHSHGDHAHECSGDHAHAHAHTHGDSPVASGVGGALHAEAALLGNANVSTAFSSTQQGPAHSPIPSRTPRVDQALVVGTDRGLSRRVGGDDVSIPLEFDSDADKYARRPANTWFAQIVGNRMSVRKPVDTNASLKKAIVLFVIGLVALITIIELATRHEHTEDDPLLDPHQNPHMASHM